ncbi:hypothetical protein C8R47DRAFT_1198503 [Mycena vitilis]|nr:hypothetical protein C8R47DRAFT_1198503 [Mycena vitilis]
MYNSWAEGEEEESLIQTGFEAADGAPRQKVAQCTAHSARGGKTINIKLEAGLDTAQRADRLDGYRAASTRGGRRDARRMTRRKEKAGMDVERKARVGEASERDLKEEEQGGEERSVRRGGLQLDNGQSGKRWMIKRNAGVDGVDSQHGSERGRRTSALAADGLKGRKEQPAPVRGKRQTVAAGPGSKTRGGLREMAGAGSWIRAHNARRKSDDRGNAFEIVFQRIAVIAGSVQVGWDPRNYEQPIAVNCREPLLNRLSVMQQLCFTPPRLVTVDGKSNQQGQHPKQELVAS